MASKKRKKNKSLDFDFSNEKISKMIDWMQSPDSKIPEIKIKKVKRSVIIKMLVDTAKKNY